VIAFQTPKRIVRSSTLDAICSSVCRVSTARLFINTIASAHVHDACTLTIPLAWCMQSLELCLPFVFTVSPIVG